MDKFVEKVDRLVFFFLIYTIIFLVFFQTLRYTLPFVLGVIFALILQKPVRYITKNFKIKNSISSMIISLVFFAIILILLGWGIGSFASEIIQLGKNVQNYISNNTSNINRYIGIIKQYYQNLDQSIINTIQNNLTNSISKISNMTVLITGKIVSGLLVFAASIPNIIMIILFTLLSTYFFTRDMSSAKSKILHSLPIENTTRLSNIYSQSKKMLGGYVTSYAIVISITFLETLVGFMIFRVDYALLLSILASFFDILPVLGPAVVYIPLAIYYGLSGNIVKASGILILYAVVFIVRQIIEPKIVSSSLGLHPVAILAAIFIGLKINGFIGMIYCVMLVIFYKVFKQVDVL